MKNPGNTYPPIKKKPKKKIPRTQNLEMCVAMNPWQPRPCHNIITFCLGDTDGGHIAWENKHPCIQIEATDIALVTHQRKRAMKAGLACASQDMLEQPSVQLAIIGHSIKDPSKVCLDGRQLALITIMQSVEDSHLNLLGNLGHHLKKEAGGT